MVNNFAYAEKYIVLQSDLAGEFPLYLYWPADKSILLYSTSITELLEDARVVKPLSLSIEGLSFLLQNGVVPPPKSVYNDIYILGIGDKAEVSTNNRKIDIQFSHKFPFLNSYRLRTEEMQADEDFILKMLAESVIDRMDDSKPSFLFHSAGKDSNSIALSLSEAGWQNKVTLITHKSKGLADESEISAKIAKKLGFRHHVLLEVDQLRAEHRQVIHDYFINAPFPCTDNVTLAYPLYSLQIPELKEANIIDGGGNDSYMMTPPTRRELRGIPLSKLTHHAYYLRSILKSESLLSPLIRTPAEWCGMSGLSFADTNMILGEAVNVYQHWLNESVLRNEWDLFDFRTSILTPIAAAEMHIRKARNFADTLHANLILPFANQRVAEYFAKMPEQYLFDRRTLKNKLILRQILKDRIGLDSDVLGKLGFTYDSQTLVKTNLDMMLEEIRSCYIWSGKGLNELLSRLINLRNMDQNKRAVHCAGVYIYRLYLISAWINCNKYVS